MFVSPGGFQSYPYVQTSQHSQFYEVPNQWENKLPQNLTVERLDFRASNISKEPKPSCFKEEQKPEEEPQFIIKDD